jgi:hypothetical protein
MLDITSEDTLTLTDACRILPRGRNGSRPQLSTLLRWILDGCRAPDRRRVRLEAVRLGNKWITSRQALQRFAAALTPTLTDDVATPKWRTPRQRTLASASAAKELERLGM